MMDTVFLRVLVALRKDDIVIFSGADLCNTVIENNESNYIYIFNDNGISLAFANGMALANPSKKVFILFNDQTLIDSFTSLLQISSNSYTNLVLILLSCKEDNFFIKFRQKQPLFFNMGFKSFFIDNYIENITDIEVFESFLHSLQGPSILIASI